MECDRLEISMEVFFRIAAALGIFESLHSFALNVRLNFRKEGPSSAISVKGVVLPLFEKEE